MEADTEEVVLTPIRSDIGKTLKIERVLMSKLDPAQVRHVAGGPYQGIVVHNAINKKPLKNKADVSKVFYAHLHDIHDEYPTKERRELRFWFKGASVAKEETANDFMQSLLDTKNFPKDYITFLKRSLSLVKDCPAINRLELHMTDVDLHDDEDDAVVNSSGQDDLLREKSGEMWASSIGRYANNGIPTASSAKLTGGVDRLFDQTDSGNSYYAQQLLCDSYTAPPIPAPRKGLSKRGEGRISVVLREPNRRQARELSDDYDGGDAAISEMAARAALAAAGVTGIDRVQQGVSTTRTSVRFTSTSSEVRSRRQIVISLRGWKVIWAAKKQRLLGTLEDVYPNILAIDDLVRITSMRRVDVDYLLADMTSRSMVREVRKGWWMRMQPERKIIVPTKSRRKSRGKSIQEWPKEHEFKVVDHLPQLPAKERPSIAFITLLYCEKLAVDAMMETKTTYARYKSDGEGQVYTVGTMGKHRVVSTKLTRVGHASGARVAAGNIVTRLLGTFGDLEHVLLVGVAGGIAQVQGDIRLGDIIFSKASSERGPIYLNVEKVATDQLGSHTFSTRSWSPKSDDLRNIISEFVTGGKKGFDLNNTLSVYMKEGLKELEGGDTLFHRPPPESDKLYIIRDGIEQEVPHSEIPPDSPRDPLLGLPIIHYGSLGTGKDINTYGLVRNQFAKTYNIKAVDLGFEAIFDSIVGNRKESFCLVRAISDYTDGSMRREWQPYASLVAAAAMKTLVMALPYPDDDDIY